MGMASSLTYSIRTSDGVQLANFPVSWYGCSTEKFQLIVSDWKNDGDINSLVKLFSLVSGIELDSLLSSTDEALEAKIYKALNFVFDPYWSFNDLKIPTQFRLNNKLYHIPQNLNSLAFGQTLKLRKIFVKNDDLRKHISLAVATYMQPIVDGAKFDDDRAMELEKIIKLMPITDTYALGIFFLNKLNQSGIQHLLLWNQTLKIILNMKVLLIPLNYLRLNFLKPIKILTMLKNTL